MRRRTLLRALSLATGAGLLVAGPAMGAVQRSRLAPGSAVAGDELGSAVAMTSGTAIIGAPKADDRGADSGAAYMYARQGAFWNQQAKVSASDGAAGAAFGSAVGVAGDIAAIGAPLDDARGVDSGAVYVFTRVGSTWSQQAKIVPSDGVAGDLFGTSVGVAGTTIVVGARGADLGTKLDTGAAYVFTRSGTAWSQQAKLTASDAGATDGFGVSVAIAGETVVAGASNDNHGSTPASAKGSAYVFTRAGSSWAEQSKLTAGDATTGDRFGGAVAIHGDTVLVGAKFDDDDSSPSVTNVGSGYVFTRSSGIWTQQAKLLAQDGTKDDMLGHSVALWGDTAVLGAWQDKVADTNSGSAYVFGRVGTAWSQQSKVTASDGAKGDKFGGAVALASDLAIIGAPYADASGLADAGIAYVFEYMGCTPTEQSVLMLMAADTARALAETLCGNHALPV